MNKQFKPLIGKEREKLIKKAMGYSKKDLAIMYVDLRWSFDTITEDYKQKLKA